MTARQHLARVAAGVLPPALVALLRRRLSRTNVWAGPYASWDAARAASGGYSAELIAERALAAAITVRDGHAAYEQDTRLHLVPDVPTPLAMALLLARREAEGPLCVLDFGGSFGSLYWRSAPLHSRLGDLRWIVIEQPGTVRRGRQQLETSQLQFAESAGEAVALAGAPSLVVASAVLPYVPDPYVTLLELGRLDARYVFVDRTQCADDGIDRCFVQRVPPTLYPASYPSWFLSWDRLVSTLGPTHGLLHEFEAVGGRISGGRGHRGTFRGGLWRSTRG